MILPLKAELAFAIQLVTRHRTPRLAALLAAAVVASLAIGGRDGGLADPLFLIAGTLVAVGAARALAPGAALGAARRVAAAPWVIPVGRLLGSVLIAGAGAVVAGLILEGAHLGAHLRVIWAMLLLTASIGAVVLALSPMLGASSAAAAGVLIALLGGIRPTGVHLALANWPVLQKPAVLAWNLGPMPWRADRWLQQGAVQDVLFLVFWLLFGLGAAAWAIERSRVQSRGEP